MADDVFIATRSFATVLDGKRVMVRKGVTRVRQGHQLLRENPERFKPLDVHYDVEQATKAPGERRKVTRKTAAKTAVDVPAKTDDKAED